MRGGDSCNASTVSGAWARGSHTWSRRAMTLPTRATSSPASSHRDLTSCTCGRGTDPPDQRPCGGFFGALKYDHLYREEIRDGVQLADEVVTYLRLYNRRRPHEALGFRTPQTVVLAGHRL